MTEQGSTEFKAPMKDRDEIWLAHLITLNQQSKITLEEMTSLKYKD